MPLLKITNGFDRLPDALLLERSLFIHSQMSGNAFFPAPWPSLPELLLAVERFQQAVLAAANGDRLQVAHKRQKRLELVELLHLLGYYVLFASRGQAGVVLSSGFQLAKDPSALVLSKPGDLRVENSNQTGQLQVSVKKVKGAVAYLLQYTTDPQLQEENWMSVATSAVKHTISGLQPGIKYFIRIGAVGTRQQVLYSDMVSRIAA